MLDDDAIELMACAWTYTLVGCIGLFTGLCTAAAVWL